MASTPYNRESFLSSFTSSTTTLRTPGSTNASSSTVFENLSAKGFEYLGKFAINLMDKTREHREIRSVFSKFPHTDADVYEDQDTKVAYVQLLDFVGWTPHKQDLRERAIGAIVEQIRDGQTRYLVKLLRRSDHEVSRLLLTEILGQLSPLWESTLQPRKPSRVYRSYAKAQHDPDLSPLILFISRLIRCNVALAGVILDVGFLDILGSLSRPRPFDSAMILEHSSGMHPHLKQSQRLLISCNAALLDIAAYPEHREAIRNHNIYQRWPDYSAQRSKVPRQEVGMLREDEDVALQDDSPYLYLSLNEICTLAPITDIGVDDLIDHLILGITHDQALRTYLLSSANEPGRVKFLQDLLGCMSRRCAFDTRCKTRHLVVLFLSLIVRIACIGPKYQLALVEAGVDDFLRRCFTSKVLKPESFVRHIEKLSRLKDTAGVISRMEMQDYAGLLEYISILHHHGRSRTLRHW